MIEVTGLDGATLDARLVGVEREDLPVLRSFADLPACMDARATEAGSGAC